MLAIQIVLQFCLTLLIPADKAVHVPLFVYFQMSLLLVFFVTHGTTIAMPGQRSPLLMPPGTVRFLIVGLVAATVGWKFSVDRELVLERLTPPAEQLAQWPLLSACLAGGFLLGHVLRHAPWRNWVFYQDGVAWVSLVCMFLLLVDLFVTLFINPSLKVEAPINLAYLEAALTAIVAAYYGARS